MFSANVGFQNNYFKTSSKYLIKDYIKINDNQETVLELFKVTRLLNEK